VTELAGVPDRYDNRPLWRTDELMRLVVTNFIGLSLIATSWYGTAGEGFVNHQVVWANLGILGILISAFGNFRHLLAGRSRVGSRRARSVPDQLHRLRKKLETGLATAPATEPDTQEIPTGVVLVRGGELVHLPTCPMAKGKDLQRLEPATTATAHRSCPVCQPR